MMVGLKSLFELKIINMTSHLQDLQPQSVWSHFSALCLIPHPSLHEAALRESLVIWAKAKGIESFIDDAGNLILKKPASVGCEAQPGIIIQGHLDMVCQANAGTQHDFEHDPIHAVVHDGCVVAHDTTLGADNGIGVALALAILEEQSLLHPPLEVLLTVNEECGMDGARGLVPGTLHGKNLINLDTEEWGHFYLGCAGGVDVEVRHDCTQEALPADHVLVRFEVSGLRGGHSGIDIHLGHGNAIKLLAEALRDLSAHTDLRLIEMKGGTARNAIPREAFALCSLEEDKASTIDEWVHHRHGTWLSRFMEVDTNVSFTCKHYDTLPDNAIAISESESILAFLDNVSNGVASMSEDFQNVTDTSSNLGIVSLAQGIFKATFKVRSLQDARADNLADKLVSRAESYRLRAWKDGAYPGWTPNLSSPLLDLCQQVYSEQFSHPASLQVIHAGLECGLLAASHPHLDMISFGPDIRGAHAPGESVEIESVARCWTLLRAVLQALAKA